MKKLLMTIVLMPVMAMALELSPSFAPEAITKYKAKADAGDAEAQFLYAWALSMGATPVIHDSAVAFDYAKKSAGQGFELAYHLVGLGYAEGWNGSSNAVESAVWYGKFFTWAKPAAEKGNAWAQLQLGQCYESGRGIEKNPKEAVKWYRKAAEQGCAIAQSCLCDCYSLGRGVERDELEEQKWERKAAEQGEYSAQVNLGLAYGKGYYGKRDLVEAVKWYRKAAEQGFSQAQCLLGLCYRRGIGVATNHAEAVKWYRKAAEAGAGDRGASYRLWLYYVNGEGVEKNLAEAVKWYCKMAKNDWQPLGDPRETDEMLAVCMIDEKGQADNMQKVYESLVVLGKGLKDCSPEVKAYYEKDLSFAKGKLDQEKKIKVALARAGSNSEVEDVVDGYTWTYRVSNDGATISSVSPKPTGDVSIPPTLGGVPVTEIDVCARLFQECEGLTSVTIPSSVRNRKIRALGGGSVGLESVFSGCDGLKQIIVAKDNQWFVSVDGVLYTKDMTELVRCPGGATSITIPKGVTCIGDSAFSYCKGLTSITMPHSVTSIGGCAFFSCTGLTSVTIPKSVTRIERAAFSDCAGLTSVMIPSEVMLIGSDAFADCARLSQINVDAANPKYVSVDGVLYTKDLKVLVQCPGGAKTVMIPKDVTKIGWRAFDGCNNLTAVTVPPSVTSIERSAFSGCRKLTSLTIPSSVANIGSFAFHGCDGLTTIVVDVDNPRYKSIDNCLLSRDGLTLIRGSGSGCVAIPKGVANIGDSAFSGCKGLASVTIPESVTSIGDSAFSGCSGLTWLTIPPSVTNIGWSAFSGCSGLKSVTVPSSVRSIGVSAFSGCGGLVDSDGFVIINGILYGYHGNAAAVTIPSNVTNIATGAFDGCSGLTWLTIPPSVTNISWSAFSGCSGLKSVTIPSSVSKVGLCAFDGCTGLTSVTLCGECPRSLAFYRFGKKLTSVTLSSSVTNVGNFTFLDYAKLRQINVEKDNKNYASVDGVLYTKDMVELIQCPGAATSITIPNGVTRIGRNAFSNCKGLMSVTIPPSVTEIGTEAFRCCNAMTSLKLCGERPNAGRNIFSYCERLKSIHVPDDAKSWAGMKEWQGIPLVFDAEVKK